MFFSNLKLALQSLRHNKMRTFLSLLGIVIGVASVVAIMTLGASATASINESMQLGGIDMVNLTPFPTGRSMDTFDETFTEELKDAVPGVEDVIPVASMNANVRKDKKVMNASVQGVYSSYFDANTLTFADGEGFTPEDNIMRNQVVVLGAKAAKDLFPLGGAVGETIQIFREQAKSYLVVGVLDSKADTLGSSYDKAIFMPYNTFDQRLRKVSIPSSYTIKVSPLSNAVDVADGTDSYLKAEMGSSSGYFIYSPANIVEMNSQIMHTFTFFLSCIAGISLIVGGIGIMNIMLVSVVERTKEIGIRKALGATPRAIQGQFLVESITITVFGGIIGASTGILLSIFIASFAGWSIKVSWMSVVLALLFSVFVGVFFGWEPAKRASRLDPIEALSRE